MDESTLGWLPILVACWMKRGHQKRIPTPGQQQWHHLFGAYNWVTDEVIYQVANQHNSETFISFLEHLVQQHSGERPLVLVLDNGSIHHSLASQVVKILRQQNDFNCSSRFMFLKYFPGTTYRLI